MRRLLRDIAEGRELGDVTTLRDPTVVERLKEQVEEKQKAWLRGGGRGRYGGRARRSQLLFGAGLRPDRGGPTTSSWRWPG